MFNPKITVGALIEIANFYNLRASEDILTNLRRTSELDAWGVLRSYE